MRSNHELNYMAPIVYDRSSGTYRYSDDSFSISNSPIEEADLQGLEIAIGILEQFRSLPVVQQFEDAILKIAASLKMNREALQHKGLIKFSRASQYKGAEHIPEIVDAIKTWKSYASLTRASTATSRRSTGWNPITCGNTSTVFT